MSRRRLLMGSAAALGVTAVAGPALLSGGLYSDAMPRIGAAQAADAGAKPVAGSGTSGSGSVAAGAASGAASGAVAPAGVTASAVAAWPDRPVTIIVSFPAGGATDFFGRTLAAQLQEDTGQTFIVDNRPGATGAIGSDIARRAKPDGYTLLVTSLGPLVITPHLVKPFPFDPRKDFDLMTVGVRIGNVLAVPAASPHRTVADVIAWEKANPGKMTFASSGTGASDHLTAELVWLETGTSGVHVPYKGGAPAIQDLIGGQVDASFQNINAVVQQIRDGKLRGLAVTSATRSAVLPDVPTLAEAGVMKDPVYSWQAVAAPKGLDPALRAKIHAALVKALNAPNARQKYEAVGLEVVGNTVDDFIAFQQREYDRWGEVIRARGIRAD